VEDSIFIGLSFLGNLIGGRVDEVVEICALDEEPRDGLIDYGHGHGNAECKEKEKTSIMFKKEEE
jgi:hypothetical protein